MKILNRYTKEIIFECNKETMKETVMEAVKVRANLSKADLSEANLSKANLSKADLSEADLSWANLSEADLSWTKLCNANFSHTKISYKGKVVEVNFTEVK